MNKHLKNIGLLVIIPLCLYLLAYLEYYGLKYIGLNKVGAMVITIPTGMLISIYLLTEWENITSRW
jgi:hypothetical protein